MMTASWNVDATKILSRREIASVLNDIKRRARRSVNSRMNLTIFRLAACCGLRASETTGLRLSDVRLGIDRPYIYVSRGIAKGRKARRVPLWWDRGTLDDLTAWKDSRLIQGAGQSDYFVCSQSRSAFGRRLDRRNARARFICACRVLGGDRQAALTIHHGRHSFVSHALAGGRSLAEVRDAAGHSNIAMTGLYTHVATEDSLAIHDLFGPLSPAGYVMGDSGEPGATH